MVVAFLPVIAPPAVAPVAANLLASAIIPDTTEGHWEGGIAYRSELCPQTDVFGLCSVPSAVPPASADGVVYAGSVGYRVYDECPTLDVFLDSGRVSRLSAAAASFAVAQELWTGTGARENPFDTPVESGVVNPYLMAPTAEQITVTPDDPMHALGLLEEKARQRTNGMDVFLHVPLRYITQLGAQLVKVGNEIRTLTGARVIGDAGYTGAGPYAGGTAEVQTVTVTGVPTGGTFTLTYAGQTTAPIPFNATAAQLQAALENLPNLNPGDIVVTGTAPYQVTFTSELGNVGQMTASGAGLTGGTTPGVTVATTTPGAAQTPAAGVWGYATGPVAVRLGPVVPMVDQSYALDRTTNRMHFWADRAFEVTFDPCCHFAAQMGT